MKLDPEALGASLRRLVAQDRGDDDDLLGSLRDVVFACVDLFDVAGSGILLADEMNAVRYVAASSEVARHLEQAEAATLQGPCTDAFVLVRTVATTDLWEETRWPEFRAAVERAPELRAVIGVPVKLGGITVGTLDLFRDQPHEWTQDEREALVRYGAVVGANLTSAMAAHRAGEQAAQLQYALDYRVTIERGVGYLMARHDLGPVEAFNLLRNAARSTRTKIGQVAQELLDTGSLPGSQG